MHKKIGEENLKYLGILKANFIKQIEMKVKITNDFLKRTRKTFEMKLCCRILI